MEKEFKKIYAFSYYTLSKSERKFPLFNLGKTFPFQYDRKHSLKIGFLWKATKKMDIGATWTYSSGSPRIYTDVFQLFDDINIEDVYPKGAFNSKRNPPYHRLDIKFNFTFEKKHGTHQLGLSVYNAYYRKNVSFYEYFQYDNNGNPIIDSEGSPISIAPILPSLNYSFKF
ncbi:MAG TPA: hypothetical protein ENJ53_01040 [Phaeodactylibacter sp.]|nr:hypothetical protein [Phaeodactylibacter sp.]